MVVLVLPYRTGIQTTEVIPYRYQAKNGSMVNPDAEYHLSFQTTQADKSHGAYQEMAEVQKYAGTVRKQMQEGLTRY